MIEKPKVCPNNYRSTFEQISTLNSILKRLEVYRNRRKLNYLSNEKDST